MGTVMKGNRYGHLIHKQGQKGSRSAFSLLYFFLVVPKRGHTPSLFLFFEGNATKMRDLFFFFSLSSPLSMGEGQRKNI